MHERAPHASGERTRRLGRTDPRGEPLVRGKADHPFQVVAVGAPLEFGQRGVAERARAGPRRCHRLGGGGRRARAPDRRVRRAGLLAIGRPRAQDGADGGRRVVAAAHDDVRRCRRMQVDHRLLAAQAGGQVLGERGTEPAERRRGRPRRRPALGVDGPAQQQALARARHRDVQDAALLVGLGREPLLAQRGERERGDGRRAVERHQTQTDPLALDEQIGRIAAPLTAEVGDRHDVELEPLRRMDRHQPDGVAVGVGHRGVGFARGAQAPPLGVVEEAAQPAPLAVLVATGETQELVDVGQPSLGEGQAEQMRVVARLAHDAAQERVDAAARGEAALVAHEREEGGQRGRVGFGERAPERLELLVRSRRPDRTGARAHSRPAPIPGRGRAARARRRTRRRAARRAPRTARRRRAGWRACAGTRAGRAPPGPTSSRRRRR